MCGMVSWATCGTGISRSLRDDLGPDAEKKIKLSDRDQRIGLNREEKAEMGKYCKYIINWGRLKYLEEFNYKCNLYYYVEESVTPENLCIVAVKK